MSRRIIALVLSMLLLTAALASVSALAEEDDWKYEYFFARETDTARIYYGLDLDKMIIWYFSINSEGQHAAMKQVLKGDAESGFTFSWIEGDTDTLRIVDEGNALLTTSDGTEYEYRIVPEEEAREILVGFQDIINFMS